MPDEGTKTDGGIKSARFKRDFIRRVQRGALKPFGETWGWEGDIGGSAALASGPGQDETRDDL